MERVAGIEPASHAWRARVLPLNYTRLVGVKGLEPSTSASQTRRATNCATPRQHYNFKIKQLITKAYPK